MVPLGGFQTNAVAVGMVKLPSHPAYTDPSLPSSILRTALLASTQKEQDPRFPVLGDPAKAVRELYRLSELQAPPLRLVLGKDCLDICREKMAAVLKDVEDYASWSKDLERD